MEAEKPPKSRIEFAREAIEALDRLGNEAEKFDRQRQGSGLFDEAHLRRMLKSQVRAQSVSSEGE